MDDIGDYLYLAIIGIAALSGILKKKKQVETAASIPEDVEVDYENDDYEEFSEGHFDPAMNQIPNTGFNDKIESSNNPKIKHTEYLSYETTIDSSKLRSQKQISRLEKSSTLHSYDDDNKEATSDESLSIEFNSPADARLAFIYSEIFNKKY